MEKKEYKLLAERENTFWWNVGRRKILEDVLTCHIPRNNGLKILDVGCGPGGNILFLKNFGVVTGVDMSDEALLFALRRGYAAIVKSDACALPFLEETFDVAVALDVLEHIENDQRALQEMYKVVRENGILLITVPAYTWMWSDHDVALHHKRRYTDALIRERVQNAGFHILTLGHFVLPAIPFRAIRAVVQYGKRKIFGNETKKEPPQTDEMLVPHWLNPLLLGWLTVERHAMKIIPIPWGSSIFIVAKK